MEKRLISIREVSELISISQPTINRMIEAKTIPSYKIGKRRLFDPEEIWAWVKKQKDDGKKPRKPKGRR
ncbi:MAG: helix-turn-helix domain-containing protein [Thermodesulfobacteriota bacterium]|jgi:excisionase family DNA binding protein